MGHTVICGRWGKPAAVSFGLAALVACGAGPRGAEPGVLRVTEREQSASFVRNFNPLLVAGDVRWPAQHAMYEPLMIHNALAERYEPWLATGYEWGEDLRSIRFDIRPDVRWSDGEAFSGDDVVFTFELMRDNPALDSRAVWEIIESVKVDGNAVVMDLRRPFVPGLSMLAQQSIVPEHIWSEVDDPVAFTNPEPVGTGPFTEVTRFSTQAYRVDRNPHYWQGQPGVTALEFFAFAANDQANLALVRGELDWAGYFVPAIDRTFVGRDPEHHEYWFPLLGGTVMLYTNTQKTPWDDVNVRKALSMAIDRELVVRIAMHGTTRPADPTGLSDAFSSMRIEPSGEDWTRHDPEAAAALLDAAGLTLDDDGLRRGPDGEPLEITLGVPAGFSDWVRATQVIARGLREVGLTVKVEANDLTAWYERLQKGEFDLSMGWTDAWPEPYGFYRALMSTETVRPLGDSAADNWHRFGSSEADVALKVLEESIDPAQRKAAYETLQKIFVEQAPAIPLFLGPLWSEYNTTRFTGFPTAEDPYAPGSPNLYPQTLMVLTRLEPR